jgi:hypothetical protein
MMAKKPVPRTHAAAKKAGHAPAQSFSLWSEMAEVSRRLGTHFPPQEASLGHIAWEGPCEGGTKVVCYYDEDMQPTRCFNVPC